MDSIITAQEFPYGTASYGSQVIWPDGREFVYGYTALTDLVKGDWVAIETDSADTTAGMNPRITKPATSAVYLLYGVMCAALTAAGGSWVQTKGQCTFAKVDGTTDVAINDFLKGSNGVTYLVQDHADTGTASAVAICDEAETAAVAAQDPITGSADHLIHLLGRRATIA